MGSGYGGASLMISRGFSPIVLKDLTYMYLYKNENQNSVKHACKQMSLPPLPHTHTHAQTHQPASSILINVQN